MAGTAFAAVGYTAWWWPSAARRDQRPAGSGSRCSPPRWSPWLPADRRSVVRLANRMAYGRGPSPTRRCPTSAAASPRRRRPQTLLPAVAEAAGRAVSATLGDRGPAGAGRRRPGTATWGHGMTARSRHVVPVRDDGRNLGSIGSPSRGGRPLRASDRRLLEALADQTAVAFRNPALERQARRATWRSSTDHAGAGRVPARIIEADDAARRPSRPPSPVRCCHASSSCHAASPRAREAVATGAAAPGIEQLVDGHQHRAGVAARADPGRVPDPAGAIRARARRSGRTWPAARRR